VLRSAGRHGSRAVDRGLAAAAAAPRSATSGGRATRAASATRAHPAGAHPAGAASASRTNPATSSTCGPARTRGAARAYGATRTRGAARTRRATRANAAGRAARAARAATRSAAAAVRARATADISAADAASDGRTRACLAAVCRRAALRAARAGAPGVGSAAPGHRGSAVPRIVGIIILRQVGGASHRDGYHREARDEDSAGRERRRATEHVQECPHLRHCDRSGCTFLHHVSEKFQGRALVRGTGALALRWRERFAASLFSAKALVDEPALIRSRL
jgi:hypothetical protein